MNLDQEVFDDRDVFIATGLDPTAIQTWHKDGIFCWTKEQLNPGPGQKRRYSALDIVRIAVTKSLIGQGVPDSIVGHIAFHLERGSPQRWREVLEQEVKDIYIFVLDDFQVARIVTDQAELAQLQDAYRKDGLAARPYNLGSDVSPVLKRLREVCRQRYQG